MGSMKTVYGIKDHSLYVFPVPHHLINQGYSKTHIELNPSAGLEFKHFKVISIQVFPVRCL